MLICLTAPNHPEALHGRRKDKQGAFEFKVFGISRTRKSRSIFHGCITGYRKQCLFLHKFLDEIITFCSRQPTALEGRGWT
jgi:hypothetical protein